MPHDGKGMRRRCSSMAWLLALGMAACGEAVPDARDGPGTVEHPDDVPRLADAIILGPSDAATTADPLGEETDDRPPGQDGGPDTGGPWTDPGGFWDLPEADPPLVSPDAGNAEDLGFGDARDSGDSPVSPPCGPEQRPCEATQVCVWDTDGQSHCAPMAECSGRGAMDMDHLVRWFLMGDEQVMPFKVRGRPWAGKATCGGPPCAEACCQTCWAFLFLGDEKVALPLMGQGVTIACQGSECDWMDHCAPMSPGQWYWIWGHAKRLGTDFRLLVEGFCPAEAPLETD